MSKQGRPSWEGAEPQQNDLLEILGDGYHFPLVTRFDPSVDKTDEKTPVYGYAGGTIDTTIVNNLGVSLEAIYDDSMQIVYDVASLQNPNVTGIRTNLPKPAYVNIVRLRKSADETYYTEAELYSKMNFVLPPPGGGPKERGNFTFDATCAKSPKFMAAPGKGIAITWDVVALTKVGTNLTGEMDADIVNNVTKGYAMVQVPENSGFEHAGKYALGVEIQRRDGALTTSRIIKRKAISFTASTVTSAGVVTITENDLLNTGIQIDDTNLYAHIMVLIEVADPAATPKYLIGDGIDCRGKFDIPD